VVIFYTLRKAELTYVIEKSKLLFFIFAVFVSYSLIQLVPLPPSIWTALPGREVIVESYQLIGKPLQWQPISMAPEKTIFSIANFLPSIAIYFLVVYWSDRQEKDIAIWGFLAFATFTVLLGFVQIALPDGPLHFYQITNETLAVGFFSNSNHQATLLLMAIPFVFALLCNSLRENGSSRGTFGSATVITLFILLTLIVGLIKNSSIAGYVLMILIVALSSILFLKSIRSRSNLKTSLLLLVAVPFFGVIFYDASHSVIGLQAISEKISISGEMSRGHAYLQTLEIIPNYLMIGAGLGSFPDIYKLYEATDGVSSVFLPHAHNDYLEILLDMGLLGGAIVVGFIFWWASTFLKLLRNGKTSSTVAKAASLAVMIVILHSFVDYPLRTIAISTLFSFSISLIVSRHA